LTGLVAQIGGLTNLSSQLVGLTNLTDQMALLTNMPAQLTALTNLPAQIEGLTNLTGQLTGLTNMSDQVGYLTNLLTTMGGVTNLIPQVAGLTNLPSQVTDLTGMVYQIGGLTNLTDQIPTLTGRLAFVASITSNIWNSIEVRVGVSNDPPSSSTLFGRIAAIQQNLASVGTAADTAMKRAQSAKTEASSAASSVQRVKLELGQGRVTQIASDVDQIMKSLQRTADLVKEIPQGASTEGLVSAIKDAVQQINGIAKQQGVPAPLGQPDIKASALTPEAVAQLTEKIAETKAMMDAMRLLMEDAAKPVVTTWLESGK
jgi:hypothetical protein